MNAGLHRWLITATPRGSYAETSITAIKLLDSELKRIKANGYSVSTEEYFINARVCRSHG